MCKVTVVMNFYNEEKYLAQAIESILNQSYKELELILVDDASTDRSNEIALSYKDSRVKVIRNQQNKGLAFSRNVGMREAKGKYIAFADADDYSALDRIEKEVRFLDERKDVLAVSCGAYCVDENGMIINKEHSKPMDKHEVKASLLFGNPISNPASMIRREVFEIYGIYQREDMRVSQDYFFWLQILKVGNIEIIPEKLLYYRVHNSKASQYAKKNKEEYKDMMEGMLAEAWSTYGFSMQKEEIHFIYEYLFQGKYIWSIIDLDNVYHIGKQVYAKNNILSKDEQSAVKKVFWLKVYNNIFYLCWVRYVTRKFVKIRGENLNRSVKV